MSARGAGESGHDEEAGNPGASRFGRRQDPRPSRGLQIHDGGEAPVSHAREVEGWLAAGSRAHLIQAFVGHDLLVHLVAVGAAPTSAARTTAIT